MEKFSMATMTLPLGAVADTGRKVIPDTEEHHHAKGRELLASLKVSGRFLARKAKDTRSPGLRSPGSPGHSRRQ